jgi:signal transduction histidine kinase
MMKYTVNDDLSFTFGSSDIKRSSDDQDSTSLKRPLANREPRKSNDSFSESGDVRLVPAMNIQGAFRAFEKLKLHRQELKQFSEEIIKIYSDMLQVDGVCLYKSTTEGPLEVLACNATWSNIFTTLQTVEGVDSQQLLLHPTVLSHFSTNKGEIDQGMNATALSLGMRNSGYIVSMPLICDGTTVGAISLISIHPQFFLPERVDVLRMVNNLTASLLLNIYLRNSREKEESERITLQKDIQTMKEQIVSHQRNTDSRVEARAVYDELEALSYSVSHDLRGPIIAIQNSCEWLSTQHAATLDTEGHALVHQISASSEHMAKLLDGLLAFSKVVQLDPQKSMIDMTALVRSVADELLKYEGGSTSLSIVVQPLMPAYGDATLIHQVWYNLLSNAFKYTRYKQKREVIIDSHPYNGMAKYCVSDNGIGFDMQYAHRLFVAFHRLHDAEEFEGTGVGLAIVQRIIRRHGGQVWAEAKVESGARFYFTLPQVENKLSEKRVECNGTI